MASMIPITTSYDLTHMYLRPWEEKVKKEIDPDSILGHVNSHGDFSKFRYILDLSGMKDFYASPQANFTLFVPSDATMVDIPDEIFLNMDSSTARAIVKVSTMKKRITSELLKDSPSSKFATTNNYNNLFVTNISGRTMLNNCINVIHTDMLASNGIIHVVDGLIWPTIV